MIIIAVLFVLTSILLVKKEFWNQLMYTETKVVRLESVSVSIIADLISAGRDSDFGAVCLPPVVQDRLIVAFEVEGIITEEYVCPQVFSLLSEGSPLFVTYRKGGITGTVYIEGMYNVLQRS